MMRDTAVRGTLGRCLLALVIVLVAAAIRLAVDPLVHAQIPYFIFVPATALVAWFCGSDVGMLAVAVSAYLANYLFVSPRHTIGPDREDAAAMTTFFILAGGLVLVVSRWRRAETAIRGLEVQARERAQELERRLRELAESEARYREAAGEARRQREELARADRAKDDFLGVLSHELRTPLNAVLGWADIVSRRPADALLVERASAAIKRAARTQATLVDELLDVARIVNGRLHLARDDVDVGAVLDAAVETVRPAAEAKGLALEAEVENDLVVTGDAGRLQQVCQNLITNAMKFTPAGGRIDVRLRRQNGQVELEVADTGVGIAPDFLPRLFTRFSQGDATVLPASQRGLGLGLTIVREIVERHGGSVAARSEGVGRGATFTIALPLASSEPR